MDDTIPKISTLFLLRQVIELGYNTADYGFRRAKACKLRQCIVGANVGVVIINNVNYWYSRYRFDWDSSNRITILKRNARKSLENQ